MVCAPLASHPLHSYIRFHFLSLLRDMVHAISLCTWSFSWPEVIPVISSSVKKKNLDPTFLCSSCIISFLAIVYLFCFQFLSIFSLGSIQNSFCPKPPSIVRFIARRSLATYFRTGKSNSQFSVHILLCLWAASATVGDSVLVWNISCISRTKFTPGSSPIPITNHTPLFFCYFFSFLQT